MSTRVETTSCRAGLLGELPTGWAQAIVTSPSRADLDRSPAALFTQLHRVLRDDGTLWLLCAEKYLPDALAESGWIARRVDWATPLRVDPAGRARLHLFVKQPRYHYNTHTAQLFLAPRTRATFECGTGRRRSCAWSPERRRELITLCVIAATARVACGACGTPYRHGVSGERRAACAHHNPCGRCLVLDPFYDQTHGTLDVVRQTGRSFLGIVDTTDSGDRQ